MPAATAGFILDCSVAMAWFFEDENDPRAVIARRRLDQYRALVPTLWCNEVTNALLKSVARKRLGAETALALIDRIEELPISVDSDDSWPTLRSCWRLAQQHALTSYDSRYLEMALRHRLPLATLDDKLARACQQAGGLVLSA